MRNLALIILLCAVVVNARWSLHYGAKDHDDGHDDHDHEHLDWWEHGVFYQVSYFKLLVRLKVKKTVFRYIQDHSKTVMVMEMEIFKESLRIYNICMISV